MRQSVTSGGGGSGRRIVAPANAPRRNAHEVRQMRAALERANRDVRGDRQGKERRKERGALRGAGVAARQQRARSRVKVRACGVVDREIAGTDQRSAASEPASCATRARRARRNS